MTLKSVIPHRSYKLLGTDIELKAGVPHIAIDARNQPDWKAKGSVFAFEGDDIEGGRAILLHSEDYTPCDITPNPFKWKEFEVVMHAAYVALADADLFDEIAADRNVSDDQLQDLRVKLRYLIEN